MREKRDDSPMDAAIRSSLERARAGTAVPCPDSNVLAAYLERRLDAAECAALESHAARCAGCQEILALALRLEDEPAPAAAAETAAPKRRVLFRGSIPIPVLALVLVAVVSGVLLYRGVRSDRPQLVAENVRDAGRSVPVAIATPPSPSGAQADPAALAVEPARAAAPATPQGAGGAPEPAPAPAVGGVPSGRVAPSAPVKSRGEGGAVREERDELAALRDRKAGGARLDDARPAPAPPASSTPMVAATPAPAPVPDSAPAGQEAELRRVLEQQTPVNSGNAQGYRVQQPGGPRSNQNVQVQTNAVPGPRDVLVEWAQRRGAESTTGPVKEARSKDDADKSGAEGKVGALGGVARKGLFKKVGDRERGFERFGGYWIDPEAARHPAAPLVEITPSAPDYAAIVKEIPAVAEMREAPVILYWNEKLYVIRWR